MALKFHLTDEVSPINTDFSFSFIIFNTRKETQKRHSDGDFKQTSLFLC